MKLKLKSIILLITIIVGSIVLNIFVFNHLHENRTKSISQNQQWLIELLRNNIGYLTVIFSGYLFYKFLILAKIPIGERSILKRFFFETDSPADESIENFKLLADENQPTSFKREAGNFAICFFGLQISYLLWGLLQEKIMTKRYANDVKFDNSQFLVFVNRVLSFTASGLWILNVEQPKHFCPIYKYVLCSYSNILSSWCQYEALKYVSFISQVLAKSTKVIPVMIMGKVLNKNNYKRYEYITAITISLGILLFMLSTTETTASTKAIGTTFSGICLLTLYLTADSFTSNWQNALFKTYKTSSIQMMCGVNFFSIILTAISLLQQNQLLDSLHFMFVNREFFADCLILSICSMCGQFFIFFTISRFGAVWFTIIMTVRQVLSILLSCLIYGHSLGLMGIFGVGIVFMSLFLRTYAGYRIRCEKNRQLAVTNTNTNSMV